MQFISCDWSRTCQVRASVEEQASVVCQVLCSHPAFTSINKEIRNYYDTTALETGTDIGSFSHEILKCNVLLSQAQSAATCSLLDGKRVREN